MPCPDPHPCGRSRPARRRPWGRPIDFACATPCSGRSSDRMNLATAPHRRLRRRPSGSSSMWFSVSSRKRINRSISCLASLRSLSLGIAARGKHQCVVMGKRPCLPALQAIKNSGCVNCPIFLRIVLVYLRADLAQRRRDGGANSNENTAVAFAGHPDDCRWPCSGQPRRLARVHGPSASKPPGKRSVMTQR